MKNKKFFGSFAFLIILLVMFAVTSYALFTASLTLYNLFLSTGEIKIDLNNGQKVFDGTDLALQPGSFIRKTMTVKNIGTGPAYYQLYMENIDGDLSDVLIFRIYEDNNLLKEVRAFEFTSDNALAFDTALEVGQVSSYSIEVYMPENTGNTHQDGHISFDLVVNAVQSKNNPNQLFD